MDISRLSEEALKDLRESLERVVKREQKTIEEIDRRLAEIKIAEWRKTQQTEQSAELQR